MYAGLNQLYIWEAKIKMSIWNEITHQVDESEKVVRLASREKDTGAFIKGDMEFYLTVNGKFNPGQNFVCEEAKIVDTVEAVL